MSHNSTWISASLTWCSRGSLLLQLHAFPNFHWSNSPHKQRIYIHIRIRFWLFSLRALGPSLPSSSPYPSFQSNSFKYNTPLPTPLISGNFISLFRNFRFCFFRFSATFTHNSTFRARPLNSHILPLASVEIRVCRSGCPYWSRKEKIRLGPLLSLIPFPFNVRSYTVNDRRHDFPPFHHLITIFSSYHFPPPSHFLYHSP